MRKPILKIYIGLYLAFSVCNNSKQGSLNADCLLIQCRSVVLISGQSEYVATSSE
jgi:hypothetical protein